MRIVFFGTYEPERSPRLQVLKEGLAAHGDEVVECAVPLGLDTAARLRMVRRPWLLPVFLARLGLAWARLWRRARRLPAADAVVVGYMGHFDVHLARRVWRRQRIVLDHLMSAGGTAADRRVTSARTIGLLDRVDASAVRAADVVVVDTDAHRELLPQAARARAVVVPVGAANEWFSRPHELPAEPLRVVFFGSYTPLQGAEVIGAAIALLDGSEGAPAITMIGRGQDYDATVAAARGSRSATWIDWVEPAELPRVVAGHHVCLGIFGTTPKARNVVPNKVFQGAAAGSAVVTSDTPPQREALGEAALFVQPGDPQALAAALAELAADPNRLAALREAAQRRAEEAFRPAVAVEPLRQRLALDLGR